MHRRDPSERPGELSLESGVIGPRSDEFAADGQGLLIGGVRGNKIRARLMHISDLLQRAGEASFELRVVRLEHHELAADGQLLLADDECLGETPTGQLDSADLAEPAGDVISVRGLVGMLSS
jgi:hypothetical protein